METTTAATTTICKQRNNINKNNGKTTERTRPLYFF